MFKVLNIFIPFLLEMLFGKKDDKVVLSSKQIWKRRIVYFVMVFSFGLNYVLVGKVYSLSMGYLAIKRKSEENEITLIASETNKAKADQLERSLEFCMRMAYNDQPSPVKQPVKPVSPEKSKQSTTRVR